MNKLKMERISNLFYPIFPERVMELTKNETIYGFLRLNKKNTTYSFDYSFSPKTNFHQKNDGYHFFISNECGETTNYPLIWFSNKGFYVLKNDESKFIMQPYSVKLCRELAKQFPSENRVEINANNFVNDTNFCYFNAVFQAMLSCSVLNWYLLNTFQRERKIPIARGTTLYRKFVETMSKLERKPAIKYDKEIEPLKKDGVFVGVGDFMKGKMCDAGEFLEERVLPILSQGTTPFMKEIIEKEGSNPYTDAFQGKKYSVIDYLFGNVYKFNQKMSERVKNIYKGKEKFGLAFNIFGSNGTTLQEQLSDFIKKFSIEIIYIPHYFIIRKRETETKIVDLPISDFDVSPYIKKELECKVGTNYRLIAMIIYIGGNHYYGIFLRKGKYYLLDSLGENQEVNEEKIIEKALEATIFVYERKHF